jgi:hypothetical protein
LEEVRLSATQHLQTCYGNRGLFPSSGAFAWSKGLFSFCFFLGWFSSFHCFCDYSMFILMFIPCVWHSLHSSALQQQTVFACCKLSFP